MFEETGELKQTSRRRGILFVPVAILAALFGILLSDPMFLGFGFVALVTFAIGLPPAKDRSKANWPSLVGIGILGVCAFALLFDNSKWEVASNLLISLGSIFVAFLVTVSFGSRLLLDLVSKRRVLRLKTNAKQYLSVAFIVVFTGMVSAAGLPKQIRFFLERSAIEKSVLEIEARCASETSHTPMFRGAPITEWKCDPGIVSFTVGTWGDIGSAGDWGFLRGTPVPSKNEGGARPPSFTHLTGSWWMWRTTKWTI
jgi:hypothetical protein